MFYEKNGNLYVEEVNVIELANKFGTPLYVTSKRKLEMNIKAYLEAFDWAKLLYAIKANNNLSIMRIIAKNGFGADVFSYGELYLALISGFNREYILFNGNSKSEEEIKAGVDAGVKFSVDSIDELEVIERIAKDVGREVEIAFRVNPDIDVKTHPKIATGLKTSKFGISWEDVVDAYKKASDMNNIVPSGVHCHIGSQIKELSAFTEALNKLFDIAEKLEDVGISIEFLDIGGGLAIDYDGSGAPTPKDLAKSLKPVYYKRKSYLSSNPELWLEPGRSVVGDTTILIAKVNAVKKSYKKFVAIDAGFNLLIRPAMYNAYHRIVIANKMKEKAMDKYTIVGPICESGDIIAEDRVLPKVSRGDIVVIFDTGAYGFVMSSQYNGRPRCAELLVDGGRVYVIRERENIGDLIAKQRIPDFLL